MVYSYDRDLIGLQKWTQFDPTKCSMYSPLATVHEIQLLNEDKAIWVGKGGGN